MNSYERSILFNLKIMKIGYAILVIVNLTLPLVTTRVLQFSIFQILVIAFWSWGMLSGLGYFKQSTPIIQIGFLRIVEAGYYLLFNRSGVNWVVFGILLFFDIAYLTFLLVDKANYKYVYEEVDNSGIN